MALLALASYGVKEVIIMNKKSWMNEAGWIGYIIVACYIALGLVVIIAAILGMLHIL